jgi:hypothetical protein
MNETFMVHTEINDENGLSTDKIQLQLKTTLNDGQCSINQTPPLQLVILSKNQDDIIVNKVFCYLIQSFSTLFILCFSFQM